ncbi:hypothetical protein HYW43_05350, partial [Candidatus Daviesbacteria bacterium]|nr:hypothetical protein [Candidatus Daviesbacteria bacterium]
MVDLFGNSNKTYPAIVLNKTVVFPNEKVPLIIEDQKMMKAINLALEKDSPLVLIFEKDSKKGKIGVLSHVAL